MKEEKCVDLIVFSNGSAYIAVKPGNPRLKIDFCPDKGDSSLIVDNHNVVYSVKTKRVNIVEENMDNIQLDSFIAYRGKIYCEIKTAKIEVEDLDGIIPLIISFHCQF